MTNSVQQLHVQTAGRVRDQQSKGKVFTFYSYKGGVGRSMALANVAVLLAKWGKRVLVIDWDLEAPGIERYFQPDGRNDKRRLIRFSASPEEKMGIVDLVLDQVSEKSLDWHDCVIKARIYDRQPPVSIITAGQPTPKYSECLQSLNWRELFDEKHNIGDWLNGLREQWLDEFDIILVDSRTGISDLGGICTIILPDVLVLMFTTNQQSIDGVVKVMRSARTAQENLPVDRDLLIALPVLARDESHAEYVQSAEWRDRIADRMEEWFRDWLLKTVTPREVLQKLYIPYVAYWSFGERLPVLEREEELEDPRKIGAAYARLATLINYQLDWTVMDQFAGAHELSETRIELQQKTNELEETIRQVRELEARLNTIDGKEKVPPWVSVVLAFIGTILSIGSFIAYAILGRTNPFILFFGIIGIGCVFVAGIGISSLISLFLKRK
jgi:MinD-like ATPase involved in chromosome partitioning or flagellar assembly